MDLLRHWVVAAVVAGALGGCATTRPIISNPLNFGLQVTDTDYHVFTRLSVKVVDQELVVHGEVEHRHGTCATEAHVDLAISDGDGQAIRAESAPLRASRPIRLGGRQTWSEPSFDARLRPVPTAGSRIAIAFHDSECSHGTTFDCGENAAAPAVQTPELSDRK